MAKRFPSQNSLVVDRAAIELDEETGALRVILTDEELPAGLVLNVPKGGRIERTLLSLFDENLEGAEGSATPRQPVAPSNPTPTTAPTPVTTPPVVTTPAAPVVPVVPVITKPTAELKVKTEKTDDSKYIASQGDIPKLDLSKKGNLISVVSPREKSAKTVTSLMLGAALARTPQIAGTDNELKVAVVDLDTTTGALHTMVPVTAKGSMGVYDSGVIKLETLLANMTHHKNLGVHILPINNEDWNALNYLGTDFLSRTVEVLKENFDVVIVDTPARDFSYITQEVIDASDVTIITNAVDRRQENPTRQWLRSHFRLKRVSNRATVLLTSTPTAQAQGALEDVKRVHAPIGIIGNIPMDSVGFLNNLRNNTVSTLWNSGNTVTDAYSVIADRLLP